MNAAPDIGQALRQLVESGADRLPAPGSGRTLARWRALADVAERDLSLVKLFEGHTDALAILAELDAGHHDQPGRTWGMWAAEAPHARVVATPQADGCWRLDGHKAWCSGAHVLSHALLTVWSADGSGPWLATVDLAQPGIVWRDEAWQAVGMAASGSVDVVFDQVPAEPVGAAGDYLRRPGFWQGGAGIAACWYGGARGVAQTLRQAVGRAGGAAPASALADAAAASTSADAAGASTSADAAGASTSADAAAAAAFRAAALGRVDLALAQTAALLRAAAAWIDAHPREDAQAHALRTRLSADTTARTVLDEVARALGPAPMCRDAALARRVADLPVFIRQSGAERDLAALGRWSATEAQDPWAL